MLLIVFKYFLVSAHVSMYGCMHMCVSEFWTYGITHGAQMFYQ